MTVARFEEEEEEEGEEEEEAGMLYTSPTLISSCSSYRGTCSGMGGGGW